MRRREFIVGLGGAAMLPALARAQERMRRIGVLVNFSEADLEGQRFLAGFRQSLQDLGWTNNRVQIDLRFGAGNRDNYRKFAVELAALAPDAVFAATTEPVTLVQQASPALPILFVGVIVRIG